MARTAASFNRGAPKFKPQPRVLVICEDTHSSKIYFEEASKYFRAFAQVEFSHCGRTDPSGIIGNAVRRAKNYERVYCVIDRDTHDEKNYNEALLAAAKHDRITVFTSHPCFEFWILLHFRFTRAAVTSVGNASAGDRMTKLVKEQAGMDIYDKGRSAGLFTRLLPRLQIARENSALALKQAEEDGNLNPSTPLHLLIDQLEILGKPIKL
jgi:hypothetical protein